MPKVCNVEIQKAFVISNKIAFFAPFANSIIDKLILSKKREFLHGCFEQVTFNEKYSRF